MKYFCTTCTYNYDEALGDDIEGISAGTTIDVFEVCPQCGEEDSFMSVQEEVNYLDDDSFLKVEKDHDIEIELLENGKIHVFIANGRHPMESEHKLISISLFDEYGELLEEKFLEEKIDEHEQIFDDYGVDDFEIQVKCSKHGIFGRKYFGK